MDEVTIALSCRDESAKSQNGRTHYDDISYDFIIGGRTVKDPQSGTASGNTVTGFQTLLNNTTGDGNTAIGNGAVSINAIDDSHIAIDTNALRFNTTGTENVA